MSLSTAILEVAVPCPLRRYFDYLPAKDSGELPAPGSRVLIQFGRQQCVGIVRRHKSATELDPGQLRPIRQCLDQQPSLSAAVIELCEWAAAYYHHPPGDVFSQALSPRLRQTPSRREVNYWRYDGEMSSAERQALGKQQKTALTELAQGALSQSDLKQLGIGTDTLKRLEQRGLVSRETRRETAVYSDDPTPQPSVSTASTLPTGPHLNEEQVQAVGTISENMGQAGVFCLKGITGSGKTEVYIRLIQEALRRGKQALMLVPEIGLTPQTLQRLRDRLGADVAASHSGMTDTQRLKLWRDVRSGRVKVVVGTRHAVWLPLSNPGLIVVDEEHDASYKQQDGFRFSARDVAVKRGQQHQCPVVLGSATPSLETLYNCEQQRYRLLHLRQRAGAAKPPHLQTVDLREDAEAEGISNQARDALEQTLARGEQAMVFINRRGFAPILQCNSCGWIAECGRCDARLTVHKAQAQLRCHHCEFSQRLPQQCPRCDETRLEYRGPGTEKVAGYLQQCFPDYPVVKVDRDSATSSGRLDQLLQPFREGNPGVLVGTQMLAKGHHFSALTTVVTVDTDAGLLSSDFRAAERSAQLLLQVSGRAGRAEKPGRVYLQTRCADHPLLAQIIEQDYDLIARTLLDDRRRFRLPPLSYAAALRADADSLEKAEQFLWRLKQAFTPQEGLTWTGPLPAAMARRAGRYRSVVLITARERRPLHWALKHLVNCAEDLKTPSDLRWAVDVDPIDFS